METKQLMGNKTCQECIQRGLNKLPRAQKLVLLESLMKQIDWFMDNIPWTTIKPHELRRFNLVENQIELLEKELVKEAVK